MKINLDKEAKLNYNILCDNLSYDYTSGIFTWKLEAQHRVVGSRAGNLHSSGYRYIELYGYAYAEHRLAWLYCFQEWPTDQIDHIDKNRSNNALDNLREVSNRQNAVNRTNNSKYGHNIYANKSKFSVHFTINGVVRRFGSHNLETAIIVRDYVYNLLLSNIEVPYDNLEVFKVLNIEYTKQ